MPTKIEKYQQAVQELEALLGRSENITIYAPTTRVNMGFLRGSEERLQVVADLETAFKKALKTFVKAYPRGSEGRRQGSDERNALGLLHSLTDEKINIFERGYNDAQFNEIDRLELSRPTSPEEGTSFSREETAQDRVRDEGIATGIDEQIESIRSKVNSLVAGGHSHDKHLPSVASVLDKSGCFSR